MTPLVRSWGVAALVALLAAGCVGATPRADFEDEVRERGGGVSGKQFEEIMQLTADEVAVTDVDQLEVLTLRADAVSRVVVVQARRGDQPEFLDTLTFRSGELASVEPVQDADRFDIEALAVSVGDLPLDDAERLVDAAIDDFDDVGALLTSFSLEQRAGEPLIVVDIESPRRSGEVVFGLDGALRPGEQE